MTNRVARGRAGTVFFQCPGCGLQHAVNVENPGRPRWTWNGDLERPTLSPSILVRGTYRITDDEADRIMAGEKIERRPLVCHSFVRDGRIEFCGDSNHDLAGRTVDLLEIED